MSGIHKTWYASEHVCFLCDTRLIFGHCRTFITPEVEEVSKKSSEHRARVALDAGPFLKFLPIMVT